MNDRNVFAETGISDWESIIKFDFKYKGVVGLHRIFVTQDVN
jgi:hypothetical protein